MSDSRKHTVPKAQVGCRPRRWRRPIRVARRGAIFIGLVLVAYVVYLVVSGQIAQFWGRDAKRPDSVAHRCLA